MSAPPGYRAALTAACARVGLDARDAVLLHVRANAVYHLPRSGVVARLRSAPGGPAAVLDRFTAAVRATRWLRGHGFPATEPLDLDQPVVVEGHVATFWRYVEVTSEAGRDVTTLARLLRWLHRLPAEAVRLNKTNPLGSLRADLRQCGALRPAQREWLLARADELERQYLRTRWVLGAGLIHGDAHAGNLLHAAGGAVLGDWDSVSHGPRELDLVPTSLWFRYGRPRAEWDQFCAAYPIDPDELPGLTVAQRMRELRALAAYLRNAADPGFAAELSHRVTSLMTGDETQPWHAM